MSYGTKHSHHGEVYILEVTSFTDYEDGHRRDQHLSVSRIGNDGNTYSIGECLFSELMWSDCRKTQYDRMITLGVDSHAAMFSFLIGFLGIGDTL